jgi:hypothetical protein
LPNVASDAMWGSLSHYKIVPLISGEFLKIIYLIISNSLLFLFSTIPL